jgi:hypothetical protein
VGRARCVRGHTGARWSGTLDISNAVDRRSAGGRSPAQRRESGWRHPEPPRQSFNRTDRVTAFRTRRVFTEITSPHGRPTSLLPCARRRRADHRVRRHSPHAREACGRPSRTHRCTHAHLDRCWNSGAVPCRGGGTRRGSGVTTCTPYRTYADCSSGSLPASRCYTLAFVRARKTRSEELVLAHTPSRISHRSSRAY